MALAGLALLPLSGCLAEGSGEGGSSIVSFEGVAESKQLPPGGTQHFQMGIANIVQYPTGTKTDYNFALAEYRCISPGGVDGLGNCTNLGNGVGIYSFWTGYLGVGESRTPLDAYAVSTNPGPYEIVMVLTGCKQSVGSGACTVSLNRGERDGYQVGTSA